MQRIGVRKLIICSVLFIIGCSWLQSCAVIPRSGPTKSDVYRSSYGRIPIIAITPATARISSVDAKPWVYPNKIRSINYETLDVGDKLDINIWENASERLYSGSQQGSGNFSPIVISGAGNIYIPYLGQIRAAGKTIDQLQQQLITRLKNKVINPQVLVKKIDGASKQISIQGIVSKPGTFETTPKRHDLISFIAEAGGSTFPPELTEVMLERKGKQYRTTLVDVFHSHKNIALHPGDNIILTEINRSFTALGATGSQKLIKFPKNDISLIEAIGLVNGLNDEMANPSHVFLLRHEKNQILNALVPALKREQYGRSQVIYELNMRHMQAVFSAQHFKVQDGDLIITTDAPYTNIKKVLSSLNPVLSVGRSAI